MHGGKQILIFLFCIVHGSLFADMEDLLPSFFKTLEYRSFTQSYPLSAHGSLTVTNLSGDITVHAWSDGTTNAATLTINSNGTKKELERTNVTITPGADSLSVTVAINDKLVENDKKSLAPAHVDILVHVPPTVTITQAVTQKGDIVIKKMQAPIIASTVTGNIMVKHSNSTVDIRTGCGNINLVVDGLTPTTMLFVNALNGNINLSLPHKNTIRSKLYAKISSRGMITSTVPLLYMPRVLTCIDKKTFSHYLAYDLNALIGTTTLTEKMEDIGGEIRLETDRGNIAITKRTLESKK